MKAKYEKYKDDNGDYHYELTLPNKNKYIIKEELGNYIHQLEQKIENDCVHPFKRLHWDNNVVFCNKCRTTLHK